MDTRADKLMVELCHSEGMAKMAAVAAKLGITEPELRQLLGDRRLKDYFVVDGDGFELSNAGREYAKSAAERHAVLEVFRPIAASIRSDRDLCRKVYAQVCAYKASWYWQAIESDRVAASIAVCDFNNPLADAGAYGRRRREAINAFDRIVAGELVPPKNTLFAEMYKAMTALRVKQVNKPMSMRTKVDQAEKSEYFERGNSCPWNSLLCRGDGIVGPNAAIKIAANVQVSLFETAWFLAAFDSQWYTDKKSTENALTIVLRANAALEIAGIKPREPDCDLIEELDRLQYLLSGPWIDVFPVIEDFILQD
jgi:hypothetical protein